MPNDQHAAELQAEQRYVAGLYERLDAERTRVKQRYRAALRGDADSLVDRDAEVHALAKQMNRLNVADHGLCFGRLDPVTAQRRRDGALPRAVSPPGEDRRPTLSWPRNIPIGGEPADVVATVEEYGAWLAQSDVPKLFVNAEPGAITRGRVRDFVRTWPNQTEVTVAGTHFIQEDSPDEIGAALASFVRAVRAAGEKLA